jgi:predicted dehydrogenase
MDVLIVGLSSLVQRRVLPSLLGLDAVGRIHVATRQELPVNPVQGEHRGRLVAGYDRALAEIEPGLAYVSLPNALHHEWCMRALAAGFHVIIDKPAFLNGREAGKAVELARRKGLCCAEATVWHYHPMLELLRELKRADGGPPRTAQAWFASPALAADNFRLDPALGGGIIYDRATYAITCGRVVFEEEPDRVECAVSEGDPRTGVDLACRIDLRYPGGGTLDGSYSLNADYRNSLSVAGDAYSVDFDRVFTPPADYTGPATVRRRGRVETVHTAPGNTFALFLEDVIGGIGSRTFDRFGEAVVRDAAIMDLILDSARSCA